MGFNMILLRIYYLACFCGGKTAFILFLSFSPFVLQLFAMHIKVTYYTGKRYSRALHPPALASISCMDGSAQSIR